MSYASEQSMSTGPSALISPSPLIEFTQRVLHLQGRINEAIQSQSQAMDKLAGCGLPMGIAEPPEPRPVTSFGGDFANLGDAILDLERMVNQLEMITKNIQRIA